MLLPLSRTLFRLRLVLLFLLGLSSTLPQLLAQARFFDATSLRQPTDLASGWLVHAGDDLAYARPDFDDSQWTSFNLHTDDLHNLFAHKPEVVWYRLHVKVAPNETGLGLLANGLDTGAFEVYSNGVRLIKAGEVAPYIHYDVGGVILVSIPDKQSETGFPILAVRVHIDALDWQWPNPGLFSASLTLGHEKSLREHMWYSLIGGNAVQWLGILVNLCMLLGAFLLCYTQRDRPEYFWLFIWLLSSVPHIALYLTSLMRPYPAIWHIVDVIYALVWPLLVARIYCAFVGHSIGSRMNLYLIFCGILVGAAVLGPYILPIPPVQRGLALIPLGILQLILLPHIILRHTRPGNRAEGLLIVPLLLGGLTTFGFNVCLALTSVPAIRDWAWETSSFFASTTAGPFSIPYDQASDLLSLLSLALIILIRSNRMSRQQALLEGEFANAREVQQVIQPEEIEPVLGFSIESVYRPAQQVGGDFFQVIPKMSDGSLLIVAGDVTGKGLRAGMLVALLIGAIRTAADASPDPEFVLHALNKRLLGRGQAQATCLALSIDRDGAATLANAGHLPPYLNGEPLEMDGALPLGMIESVEFSVMHFELNAGDKLVLMSDGIAEATDSDGRLFGFERIHDLLRTAKSASELANAAQSFGQEDDISVISVTRTPVLEPASA